MIQPFLAPVNGTKSDLHAVHSEDDDGNKMIEVYWGCGLLLTVPVDPSFLYFRVIVGILYNATYSVDRLESFFKVSAKTIRRWGLVLKDGSPDKVMSVLLGVKGIEKLSEDARRFVKVRYLELRDGENPGSVKNQRCRSREAPRYSRSDYRKSQATKRMWCR